MRRGPAESRAKFAKRRYCSAVCYHGPQAVVSNEDRFCARPDCGVRLVRRAGERPSAFRDRRYCDGTCERLRGGVEPVRHCLLPECGVRLVRRANERPNQFRGRQFCCVGHRVEARRGRPKGAVPKVNGDWSPGERYTAEQLLDEWEHFSGFNPRLTPADLAERLRVSERTVQRALGVAS